MDASTKQACFDEISHQIFDADAMVNIYDISSKWQVDLRHSERLLWDWYEKQNKDRAMSKQFLIRGVDCQGKTVISVIKERQMSDAKTMFPVFSSSLFSLELPSPNVNRLGTHQLTDSVVVNLPIEPKIRERSVPNGKSIDQPLSKPSTTPQQTNGVHKAEAKVEPKPSPPKPVAKPEETVKVEAETPKKESPKKIAPQKSASKAPIKQAAGKSSIASFFGKPSGNAVVSIKPPTIKNDSVAEVKAENAKPSPPPVIATPTDEPMDTQPASTAASRKRSLADLVDSDNGEEDEHIIPATPTPTNKRKKTTASTSSESKKKPPAKRVAKAKSSSDDDIPGTPQPPPVTAKKTNGKKATTRSRQVIEDSDEDEASAVPKPIATAAAKTGKRKALRTVTRMVEDEDGYTKTIKEQEEYTCSEDDNMSDDPQNGSAAVESAIKVSDIVPKKVPTKSPPVKKTAKISPPGKTAASSKQGSIMNFFKKK